MYQSNNPMFKSMTGEEEARFREWARENDPPAMTSWSIYHPVCREEWVARGVMPPNFVPCESCKVNAATIFQFCGNCASMGVAQ